MPLQLRDKSNFIPKLTPIAIVFKLNLFNTYSLSSQSTGASVQIQTLGHPSPKLESWMAGQNQAAQVNFTPVSFIRHYPFSIFTSDFSLRLFLIGAFHRAFDSYWGQLDVLFSRTCGNFRSPRVHCSWIPKNPFQGGVIRTFPVARCFQELAFAPNCRLEKLV
jgi:hypothetical protein